MLLTALPAASKQRCVAGVLRANPGAVKEAELGAVPAQHTTCEDTVSREEEKNGFRKLAIIAAIARLDNPTAHTLSQWLGNPHYFDRNLRELVAAGKVNCFTRQGRWGVNVHYCSVNP